MIPCYDCFELFDECDLINYSWDNEGNTIKLCNDCVDKRNLAKKSSLPEGGI